MTLPVEPLFSMDIFLFRAHPFWNISQHCGNRAGFPDAPEGFYLNFLNSGNIFGGEDEA